MGDLAWPAGVDPKLPCGTPARPWSNRGELPADFRPLLINGALPRGGFEKNTVSAKALLKDEEARARLKISDDPVPLEPLGELFQTAGRFIRRRHA